MKRLAVLVAVLACSTSAASAATPEVDARAYLVQEAQSGEVLLARRAHDRLPIASITKLMTVLVALERSKPGAMVSVDRDAVGRDRIDDPAPRRVSSCRSATSSPPR